MNRCEWILIGSSGEAEAEPHEFLGSFDGKPEAYRYVLRQSRLLILNFRKVPRNLRVKLDARPLYRFFELTV